MPSSIFTKLEYLLTNFTCLWDVGNDHIGLRYGHGIDLAHATTAVWKTYEIATYPCVHCCLRGTGNHMDLLRGARFRVLKRRAILSVKFGEKVAGGH
jgi:hypothetical protein